MSRRDMTAASFSWGGRATEKWEQQESRPRLAVSARYGGESALSEDRRASCRRDVAMCARSRVEGGVVCDLCCCVVGLFGVYLVLFVVCICIVFVVCVVWCLCVVSVYVFVCCRCRSSSLV